MKVHELKILPQYYDEIMCGKKKFEIRKNDRDFKEDDTVILNEFIDGHYTGRYIKARINYIFHGGSYGLEKGYCVFSISVYECGCE